MRPSVELNEREARRALVNVLQSAHAGELGAARAYRGHWRSLTDDDEVADVRRIEREEIEHRSGVSRMLALLGSRPAPGRERVMGWIGNVIACLCQVGGWYVPMYGAGRLESKNAREYEDAARFALLAGREDLCAELLQMAEVEWDHEQFFRAKVEGHWLAKLTGVWPTPPRRERIQESFGDFAQRVTR